MKVTVEKTYWCSCGNAHHPHTVAVIVQNEHRRGSFNQYIASNIEFCCEKMRGAFDERFVVFGEYDSIRNEDTRVNIIHCDPYPEGAVFGEMAIERCPWCGEKIETLLQEVV